MAKEIKSANVSIEKAVKEPLKQKGTLNKKNISMLKSTGLNKQEILGSLRLMVLARGIDTKAMNLLKQGRTFFHIAGAGHEAIQTAIGKAIDPKNDWLFPYYRDLAVVLAVGVTPVDFFLECFAKADDPSSGARQLPCHWGAKKINLPSQSSPTGTQFLQAVGVALSLKRQNKNNFAYVSSGEGTTSQGEFHEAVNWSSREKLPVLFLIENNKYAISVNVKQQSGGKNNSIAEMMSGYSNLLRLSIDGTDYIESHNGVKEALKYIKSGKGPVLIEAHVVRLLSHSSSDDQKKYRDKKELEEDLLNCPILKLSNKLINEGIITEDEFKQMEEDVKKEINKAADESFSMPDPLPETAGRYVFDESGKKENLNYESSIPDGAPIVMVDAINHALQEELENNEDLYVFGQDIADGKGGVFTATKGLSKRFGEERVFNSPLAEASIMGVAAGMALTGLKPVVEIQFGDYIWPGLMQIKSEIATMRYRSNNTWFTSVVTRVPVGGYIHGGLYHSQNIESIFAHIPGLFIAYPSNAADAKGLLKTACRIDDPVIFCEHKGLYRQSSAMSPEPDENYLLSFGKAKVVNEGTDITVISYGVSMWDSVLAAKTLADEGYAVEVIDLRTIIPLDVETIFNSVKKTNKVVVIHEDTLTGGFGAEIVSRISDECFEYLDGPVKRIAAIDSHIPYSPILENAILPNRKRIYEGIKELLKY